MHIQLDLPSGRQLVAQVDPGQEAEGRALLARLVDLAAPLVAGSSLDAGVDGVPLRLRAEAGDVQVHAPVFFGPSGQYTAALAGALRLLQAQQALLRSVGAQGLPVQDGHYLRISEAALGAVSVFGFRVADEVDGLSSGWTLTAADEMPTQARCGQYMVREAAALRPEWLMALPLPAGWSFRYAGRTLLDCVSPGHQTHSVRMSFDG